MIWQDAVLTLGSILLLVALVPSLLGKDKPASATSLVTGAVLLSFAATYWTLGLSFSGVVTAASGVCWLALAAQKFIRPELTR